MSIKSYNQKVTLTMPKTLVQTLKTMAETNERSLSVYLTTVLTNFVDQNNHKTNKPTNKNTPASANYMNDAEVEKALNELEEVHDLIITQGGKRIY